MCMARRSRSGSWSGSGPPSPSGWAGDRNRMRSNISSKENSRCPSVLLDTMRATNLRCQRDGGPEESTYIHTYIYTYTPIIHTYIHVYMQCGGPNLRAGSRRACPRGEFCGRRRRTGCAACRPSWPAHTGAQTSAGPRHRTASPYLHTYIYNT